MEHVAIKRADLDSILKLISRIRDDLDALQEELEMISNKELAGKIEEGIADIKSGRVFGLEEFERALKNK
jgi:hypothetical protein